MGFAEAFGAIRGETVGLVCWLVPGTVRESVTPAPGQDTPSPPPQAHHPETEVTAAATATGSEVQGPARSWLGGRTDGRTNRQTEARDRGATVASATRAAAGLLAPPRPVPGTPAREGGKEGVWEGGVADAPPRLRAAPRQSGVCAQTWDPFPGSWRRWRHTKLPCDLQTLSGGDSPSSELGSRAGSS